MSKTNSQEMAEAYIEWDRYSKCMQKRGVTQATPGQLVQWYKEDYVSNDVQEVQKERSFFKNLWFDIKRRFYIIKGML